MTLEELRDRVMEKAADDGSPLPKISPTTLSNYLGTRLITYKDVETQGPSGTILR
jgi:hypothetical protein